MSGHLRRQTGPFREIARTAWQNRDQPLYAWRILKDGVCDGCALGTSGMRDWTIEGVHLCWIRLNLLRLNTMPALDPQVLGDVEVLAGKDEKQLRDLGRIPFPMLRRRGDRALHRLSWEEALDRATWRLRAVEPRRLAFYLVSRGTVNETYYAAQKAARYLGTNHVDNSARICHSSSTVGLKQTIGYAATTCSYADLLKSDLVVFIGSDAANNQPVVMKYLHLAKKRGTRVAVINPFREPGMERYWVPSSVDSALLGTKVCDEFFQIRVGGDIAFFNGVLKHLIAREWVDRRFIREHTEGWAQLEEALAGQTWVELEAASGAPRELMFDFARLYSEARSAIFVWSMGLTMHRHGVANVRALADLALARGMVGRSGAGLMPIRGHSGVQGGAEMGCVPNVFPGGRPVDEEGAHELSRVWGFEVPGWRGNYVAEIVEAAERGEVDALYCVGSNLLGVLPDREFVRRALEQVPFRVHHDIVLNPQMFVEPGEEILILPATTRYEMAGGNTETSTERRVIFNPEIPGPRIEEARDEWRVLTELAARVRPEGADKVRFEDTAAIRREIARVIPLYDGIQDLARKGDQFQWGGPMLCKGGRFARPGGRARFIPETPPNRELAVGSFILSTRRGKQFNSMVFGARDMIVGAGRNGVVMASEDMVRMRIDDGDRVRLSNETGVLEGRARVGQIRQGTVMVYWPEANVLVPRGVTDPECGIPAYRDAVVRVEPLSE